MKYVVTVNGKKFEVEVEKVGGAARSLSRQPVERGERTVAAAAPVAPAPVATPAPAAPVARTTAATAAPTTLAAEIPVEATPAVAATKL